MAVSTAAATSCRSWARSRWSPAAAGASGGRWCWPLPAPAPTWRSPAAISTAARPWPPRSRPRPVGGRSSGCHVGHWDEFDDSSTPPTPRSARSTSSSTTPACRRCTRPSSASARSSSTRSSASTSRARSGWLRRRRADGRGRRRVDHQREQRRRRPTDADRAAYAAAKAGLNTLTIGFAQEYGPKVRVNSIHVRAVLHRHLSGMGPGAGEQFATSPRSGAASPTRSSAPRSTWPATPPASPPAPCSVDGGQAIAH